MSLNKILVGTLTMSLGFSGITYEAKAEEVTLKQKVEKVVKYLEPLHTGLIERDSFLHHGQKIEFYLLDNGNDNSLLVQGSTQLSGFKINDFSSNGYGSVDALEIWFSGKYQKMADRELLKNANEAYLGIINAYLKEIERRNEEKAAAEKKALEEIKNTLEKLAK